MARARMGVKTRPGAAAAPGGLPALPGGRCRCGQGFFPFQPDGCERCGATGDALQPALLTASGRLVASARVLSLLATWAIHWS